MTLFAAPAGAQEGVPGGAVAWVLAAGILPLVAISATAFAKISVVLGILRGGLGAPDALPAPVLAALAAVLAALVMAPVATRVVAAVGDDAASPAAWSTAAARAWPEMAGFLDQHTRAEDRALIADVAGRLAPDAPETAPMRIAAFLLSELTAAFTLGVLVLLPFLVVDLLVAHTLTILGFHLLPPALVALPFKLLLFVAAGGWGLVVRGLVGSYAA